MAKTAWTSATYASKEQAGRNGWLTRFRAKHADSEAARSRHGHERERRGEHEPKAPKVCWVTPAAPTQTERAHVLHGSTEKTRRRGGDHSAASRGRLGAATLCRPHLARLPDQRGRRGAASRPERRCGPRTLGSTARRYHRSSVGEGSRTQRRQAYLAAMTRGHLTPRTFDRESNFAGPCTRVFPSALRP